MTFARIRSMGSWIDGSTVLDTEFEAIDAHLAEAIDGAGGGAYSLTDGLSFGSSGGFVTVTFTNAAGTVAGVFNGTSGTALIAENNSSQAAFSASNSGSGHAISASGGISCAGNYVGTGDVASATITCSGHAAFNGTAEFAHYCQFDDDVLFNSGNIGITNHLTVDGTATFIGATTLAGAVTCSSTVALNGEVTLTAPLVLSGTGHIAKRLINGVDGPATYGINDADVIIIPALLLNATRVYTMSATGAVSGEEIRIPNYSPTYTINLSGVTAIVPSIAPGTWVDLLFSGGTWIISARGSL